MPIRLNVNAFRFRYDASGNQYFKQMRWGAYDFLFPPRVGDKLSLWHNDMFFDVSVKEVWQSPMEHPISRDQEAWPLEAAAWIEVEFLETEENQFHADRNPELGWD